MITWNETREKTLFGSYSTALSESASWNETNTEHNATYNGFTSTESTAHNAGANSYIVGKFDGFWHEAGEGAQFSTTYHIEGSYTDGFSSSSTSLSWTYRSFGTVEGGGTNPPVTYSSTDSYSFTDSATTEVFNNWQTISSSTQTVAADTTRNDTISSSYITLTGSPQSGYSTTNSTHTLTAMTLGTTVSALTSYFASGTTQTIGGPQEYGTIVSAQANDWLWSMTAAGMDFGATPSFLTDVARSFTKETFWHDLTALPLNYATYGETRPTGVFSSPGNESTITLGGLDAVTVTATYTSGNMLSRDTYTAEAITNSVSTYTQLVGNGSYSIDAISSSFYTTVYYSVIPHTAHVMGQFKDNYTQTTLATTTYRTTTVSSLVALPEYQATSATIEDGVTHIFGQSVGSTQTNIVGVGYARILGGYTYGADDTTAAAMTYFAPIAAQGAFLKPGELAHGGNAMNFATNLSLGGGQILAPAVSSVFANVVTPAFKTARATNESAGTTFTWLYSQSENSLSYTKSSTHTIAVGAETRTVTDSTTTAGTFNSMESASTFVEDGGNVLGGYQDVSTAAESAYYLRAGIVGTHNDTDGGSSTYRTIRTAETSDTKSGDIFVEREMMAVVTWGGLGHLAHPIFVFDRYNDGGEQG